ncbi:transglutaminase-like cysteine peptidase [Hahella sp. CR1]|uniref:transglutaminase-like cysteine peptidase n=1 Tax=Hahella sp. CR1 TaxID=2992807 RepID=UPI002442D355|nr:transglutaminase-like cysteine peptidase [Hahella sp. CR1]MDG9671012.1 transglutaminase-like cysteine peptidase [Hahella sp. CR1]
MQWTRKLRVKTAITLFSCWALVASAAFEISQQILTHVEREYGGSARERLERWQKLLNTPKDIPDERKLMMVNVFFNETQFVPDIKHWGQEDYWATPVELLVTNGGDCEDYSIAKYFALREMGVPDDKLRITYVKALKLNQAHMVLAYYPDQDKEPLILDNLIQEIRSGSERDDLYPIYSFNGDGLWLSKQRGLGKRVGQANRLDQWNDLNTRMLQQLQTRL